MSATIHDIATEQGRAELARRLSVSRSYLNQMLSGERRVSAGIMSKLRRIYRDGYDANRELDAWLEQHGLLVHDPNDERLEGQEEGLSRAKAS